MTTKGAYLYFMEQLAMGRRYIEDHAGKADIREHEVYVEALEKAVEMFELVIANDEEKLKTGKEKYIAAQKIFLEDLKESQKGRR
jgi:hypothetical protein